MEKKALEVKECCLNCRYSAYEFAVSKGIESLVCDFGGNTTDTDENSLCVFYVPDEDYQLKFQAEIKLFADEIKKKLGWYITDNDSLNPNANYYEFNRLYNTLLKEIAKKLLEENMKDKLRANKAGYSDYADWDDALLDSSSDYDGLASWICAISPFLKLNPDFEYTYFLKKFSTCMLRRIAKLEKRLADEKRQEQEYAENLQKIEDISMQMIRIEKGKRE